MWQRIQTVYMALAAILLLVTALTDIPAVYAPSKPGGDNIIGISVQNMANGSAGSYKSNFPMLYLCILAVGALVNILQFRDRKKQMTVSLLIAVFTALYYLLIILGVKDMSAFHPLGGFLPATAAILMFLAWVQIRKDDKLVKSLDRFR